MSYPPAMRTAILLCLLALPVLADDELPYPRGKSTQTLEGLEFALLLPSDYDASREYALIYALHGMHGKAVDLVDAFQPLTRHGFVVVAPQSPRPGWDQANVNRSKAIITHLIETLSIDAKRLHGAAYSQGCGSLASVVFDRDFHFISASWGMGGSSGGKVPPWGKKEMGIIALVGSEDWGRGAAESTVKQFARKVRIAECHVEQGIGHEFPSKLQPYHHHWLRVMDGWFEPGEVAFFDWRTDLDAAKETMASEERGGLVYVYSQEDADSDVARRVQNEVLFDPLVRHYGRQAVAVKIDREAQPDLCRELGVTQTPAALVLDADGEPQALLEGKRVKASTLAKRLRKVAADRKPPKSPGVYLHP